jgi:hypothetical protein
LGSVARTELSLPGYDPSLLLRARTVIDGEGITLGEGQGGFFALSSNRKSWGSSKAG